MGVEEQYGDVLQNIESAIVRVHRSHPAMSDYDVMRALEVLIDNYSGERIGRPPRSFRLSEVEHELVERMRAMCEWRLGRSELYDQEGSTLMIGESAITVDEIILCLKRLQKSAKLWNKEGGTQGYLNFIEQFIR